MGLFSSKKKDAGLSAAEQETIFRLKYMIDQSKTSAGKLGESSVRFAARLLHEDEEIKYAMYTLVRVGDKGGALKSDVFSLSKKKTGVVVLTNHRIFCASDTSGAEDSVSFYISDIDTVDMDSTMLGATLRVQARSSALSVDGVKENLSPFREKIEAELHKRKAGHAQAAEPTESAPAPAVSAADEILKYKQHWIGF